MNIDELEHSTPFLKILMEEEGGELLKFVQKEACSKYGSGVSADVLEDMVQSTIVTIIENLEKYDERLGDTIQFLKFYTKIGLNKAYQESISYKTGKKISSYIRKRSQELTQYAEQGMSVKDIAEAEHMKEKTVLNLINAGTTAKSLDANNEDDKCLYAILASDSSCKEESVQDDKEQKDRVQEKIDSLGFMDSMERYIIETYASNIGYKNWKKRTVDTCAERGISKKKVVDTINKYRSKSME